MNTAEIKILINKYYEGETSLDDEKLLKGYFSSDEVADQFKEHIPIFEYYLFDRNKKTAPEFGEKIIGRLGQQKNVPFYRNKKFFFYTTGIAASVIFLLALIFESTFYNTKTDAFADASYTREETQIAYDQTKKALAYVSEKYAQGVDPLGDIAKFRLGALPVNEIAKLTDGMNSVNYNVNKMNVGVENLSRISKFTIIVKP